MAKSKTTSSPVPRLVNDFFSEIRLYSDFAASMKWDENSSYQLISKQPYETRTTVHERQVPVVRLKNGFFIYAAISYDTEAKSRKKELSSISMHFFDDASLLFRAELANPKFHKEEIGHPQPHWHLAGNNIKSVSSHQEGFMAFVEEDNSFTDFVGEETEEQKYDYSRLHFTMNYNHQILESFDDASVREWTRQCLKAVDSELTFLSTKSHTEQVT